jgi:hypothetical protein
VAARDIVNDDHALARLDQLVNHDAPDVARAARYKYCHIILHLTVADNLQMLEGGRAGRRPRDDERLVAGEALVLLRHCLDLILKGRAKFNRRSAVFSTSICRLPTSC